MEVGVADLRQRLREVLARVEQGDKVSVTRRGRVVAVVAPPQQGDDDNVIETWRQEFGVDDRGDEGDPWDGVRDPSPGPPPVVLG